MRKDGRNSVTLHVTKEYKAKLDKAVLDLSSRVSERVPATKVIYALLDGYLDQAVKDVEKNY
jgi:hypothetical protein